MAMDIPVVGLILAGGAGERLGGVRKADIRLGNVRLLERVRATLEPQCDALLLSVGAGQRSAEGDVIALADDPHGITGPAAGLWAGARWCENNMPGALLVSASVDTPFLPEDFVRRSLALLDADCGCVVGAYDSRDYPTNALWRADRLLAHLATLRPAPRGPRLRDIQSALAVRRLDYADSQAGDPFIGINRVADLLALNDRLGAVER
jgi:molybdopterin-guanine dinucleotide biosynthesis protein A